MRATPGRRVPGTVDGFELAVRAVIGQQVSVAAARTVAGRLAGRAGRALAVARPPVTHTFPSPPALARLAESDPAAFAMPAGRRRARGELAGAVAGGRIAIDPGSDPVELEAALGALPGIGAWTSSYIAMRALGDPDAFLPTDLGVRRGLGRLGEHGSHDPRHLTTLAERWRPWRAYAVNHLWSVPSDQQPSDEQRTRGESAA